MLTNLLLVSMLLFYNATFTRAHNPWFKKLCFCCRHPRYWGADGNLPKDWVRKKKSISTEISKPVIEVKEPSSSARPPFQPTCHPHLQGPIHHAAWKCRSQIQSHKITVKASPARRQIPVLTAPGIKAKNRGSTWHKGCGTEKWASSLNVSSRLGVGGMHGESQSVPA